MQIYKKSLPEQQFAEIIEADMYCASKAMEELNKHGFLCYFIDE